MILFLNFSFTLAFCLSCSGNLAQTRARITAASRSLPPHFSAGRTKVSSRFGLKIMWTLGCSCLGDNPRVGDFSFSGPWEVWLRNGRHLGNKRLGNLKQQHGIFKILCYKRKCLLYHFNFSSLGTELNST